MIRKVLIVFFLIGLVVSAGLFASSMRYSVSYIPGSLRFEAYLYSGILFITWPDDPYVPLTTEDALSVLPHIDGPPGMDLGKMRHWLLTARPFKAGHAARPGFAMRRERPNLSALRYFSLRLKRVANRREYRISVGLWVPVLLCLAGSCASFFHGRRRRKRKQLGLCLKCGYDLRASEDRCPECGNHF